MQEFEHSQAPDHNRYIRKVTLPSGKTIEVISFEHSPSVERELHVCPECASARAYPFASSQADRPSWELRLPSPNSERHAPDLSQTSALPPLHPPRA